MSTELTQEELAAVEAGRKARGVVVPAAEAYREAMAQAEQPKGLDAVNISNEGIVDTVPVVTDTNGGSKSTSSDGIKVVPIAGVKGQEVELDDKIDPNVAPSTDSVYMANKWNEYVNSIYGEDQRIADEKKKKAAHWILAAQMLGDSLGALSNVYWTGKGANAMKFEPGAPKAAAATYQLGQDIRNAREKAAKAKVDATLQMFKMKMDEKRYADALKQQGIENTIKLGNLEISRAKLANDMEYQKQMLDLRAQELIQNGVKADQAFKLSMEELGLKKEQIKLDKDELQARINGTYYSGSGRGSSKLDPVQTSQGDMLIDESKLNATNLAQYEELAAQSGDDGLANAIRNLDGGTRSITALKQELGRLLKDPANKAIVDHMVSNGILVANTKSGQNNGGKILGLK